MNLGIVGHAEEKFTPRTKEKAKAAIRDAIKRHRATCVISGHSPMGGVDLYAEEIAAGLNLPMRIYPPKFHRWDGIGGFKERNLRIAHESDLVLVVVVEELPPGYHGMRFDGCYHCRQRNPPHVKSGGCWTAWRCANREWSIMSVERALEDT